MRLSKRLVFFLSLGALFVFVNQYRKTRIVERRLVRKSKVWAQAHKIMTEEKLSDDEKNGVKGSYTKEDLELMEKIQILMEKEKPYKDENFSLEKMAVMLDVHRNTISRVINQIAGKRFKRFVNEYRISEAIQIISSSEESPCVESIMFDVGFRSRSPFFETFKSLTGVTPSTFIKTHKIRQKEKSKI